MKLSKVNLLILGLLLSIATFSSCGPNFPFSIFYGSQVTVTNTFQSDAFTNGAELAIEDLFQVPAGSLAATARVGPSVEFSAYLLGLYDIDIDKNDITFEVVAASDDPTYGALFRILEPNTYDRYYLTFDKAQNVNSFSSSDPAVNLRIDSNKILVVEIGEGFDFQPGATFTITLD